MLPGTIATAITPEDWYGIITADDDGPWPVCCANVSAVREVLTDLLTVGGAHEIARAGQALAAEVGDHFDPASNTALANLYAALATHLDATRPTWRTDDLDHDHDGLDDFTLKLSLTGTSEATDAQPAPAPAWARLLAEVATAADTNTGGDNDAQVAWFDDIKARLETLRLAGAPTGVAAALYRHAHAQLHLTF